MKRYLTWFLVGLFLFSLPSSAGAAIPAVSNVDMQKYIVIFDKQVDKEILTMAGGKIDHEYGNIPACAITVPGAAIKGLQSNPHVVVVEPDVIVKIEAETPSWGIEATNAPAAWDSGLTGKGVRVAVVDTGIASHSDLAIAGGVSFISRSYADDNGHGTHVAGIIGARDNEIGTIGIAPQANLYAVKVLDKRGSGYLSDVIAGIDWAITEQMDIVNLSLGAPSGSDALKAIVDTAYSSGVLVVAAAGNEGTAAGDTDTVSYPARYDTVIAVAAIGSNNIRPIWSSTGSRVEVAAPGVGILSTYLGNGYATMSGTSMAAPFVTGDLALLKQEYPEGDPAEMRALLDAKVKDLGSAGRDTWYGFGLIQAPVAVNPPAVPTATQTTVTTGRTSYRIGQTVYIYGVVTDTDGNTIAGATVNMIITTPSSIVYGSGTTDGNGKITFNYSIPRTSSAKGKYTVLLKTTYSDYDPSSASTTFVAN